mmetsp:Transcript_131379/g.420497  ORF Transcript_131379/g.420497 Transcript_131379/m.420497 type:complete len:215 (+) Transcript_131379:1513-2157(+)
MRNGDSHELCLDLPGQLTRRGQRKHQRLPTNFAVREALGDDPLHDRQAECQGFAAAGLRAAHSVLARPRRAEGAVLHLEQRGEAFVLQTLPRDLRQALHALHGHGPFGGVAILLGLGKGRLRVCRLRLSLLNQLLLLRRRGSIFLLLYLRHLLLLLHRHTIAVLLAAVLGRLPLQAAFLFAESHRESRTRKGRTTNKTTMSRLVVSLTRWSLEP